MSGHHGRDQWQKLTLAAEKDGTVTGLKVELDSPTSARTSRSLGGGVPVLGAFMFNAIYKFPAYQFNCQTVFTNKTWTDAYRGAGRPEATYAIERLMDELAARARRRPARDPREELDQARRVPVHHGRRAGVRLRQLRGGDGEGQGALRVRRAAGRAEGAPRAQGPGPAGHRRLDVHRDVRAGAEPDARRARLRRRRLGARRASGCCATGKVEVVTGVSAHGQGHETAFSQIVADRLGVPFEDVEVLHGDTQVSPRGLDTYGSRSLVVGGEALVRAADKVIEKAKVDRRAPARGQRRRHRVRRGPLRGRAAPTRAWASPRSRWPPSRRTTCPTAWSPASTPTRPSTR